MNNFPQKYPMLNLITKSIYDPSVLRFIKKSKKEVDEMLKAKNYSFLYTVSNKKIGLGIHFFENERELRDYRLFSISLEKNKLNTALRKLPLGMRFEDTMDSLTARWEGRTMRISKTEMVCYGTEYEVYVRFDKKSGEAMKFDYRYFGEGSKSLLEKWEGMERQVKNLVSPESFDLQGFLLGMPPRRWERLLKEKGLDYYNEAYICDCKKAVGNFVWTVHEQLKANSAKGVMDAVLRVVADLNDVNSFPNIDTSDREELCRFIRNVVKEAGIKIPPRFEVTIYRDW